MNIDVIIPVFNGAEFIERAVASVLSQSTDATLTVFCIDDLSTDASWSIIQQLAREHPSVRANRNPRNLGVAATRNRGVALGAGEYVAFLDQDDAWLPNKTTLQSAVFTQQSDIAYVVGKQKLVVDDGHVRPAWCRPEWLETPQAGYLPSALIVRRAAFLELGLFDERMRAGGDDSDWFARARRFGVPHVHLDETVFIRYVHDTNVSSDRGTDRELLTLVRRHVAESRRGGNE